MTSQPNLTSKIQERAQMALTRNTFTYSASRKLAEKFANGIKLTKVQKHFLDVHHASGDQEAFKAHPGISWNFTECLIINNDGTIDDVIWQELGYAPASEETASEEPTETDAPADNMGYDDSELPSSDGENWDASEGIILSYSDLFPADETDDAETGELVETTPAASEREPRQWDMEVDESGEVWITPRRETSHTSYDDSELPSANDDENWDASEPAPETESGEELAETTAADSQPAASEPTASDLADLLNDAYVGRFPYPYSPTKEERDVFWNGILTKMGFAPIDGRWVRDDYKLKICGAGVYFTDDMETVEPDDADLPDDLLPSPALACEEPVGVARETDAVDSQPAPETGLAGEELTETELTKERLTMIINEYDNEELDSEQILNQFDVDSPIDEAHWGMLPILGDDGYITRMVEYLFIPDLGRGGIYDGGDPDWYDADSVDELFAFWLTGE